MTLSEARELVKQKPIFGDQRFLDAIKIIELDKLKCNTCGGWGYIECECCDSEVECEDCDGTGRVL